ncbi:RNaseH domain-containing protein [Amycolatopsis thermoflava]|uniref:RNaseH domain-containing protein n=1 Tax=Amycolatopsis thermoflava TaxID=84480 RepID=UPI0003FABB18|nr:RNaseH domain-containing protein [Amycolatopsis thermoflava]
MLISLAYRVPPAHLNEVFGSITAYPLTEEFLDAWKAIPHSDTAWGPQYASLARGLTSATGRPVTLFGTYDLDETERANGKRMLLLTDDGEMDYRLRIAMNAWERHVRGGADVATIAPLLPDPERARPFSEFIKRRAREVPEAANWVFRTGMWRIMRALAEQPLAIDGRAPLPLRMDTSGGLVAWDDEDLIANGKRTAFSMLRISGRLVTRAGVEDPVLCFDAHLTRISPKGAWANNVWIEPVDARRPILHLPMKYEVDRRTGVRRVTLHPATATIYQACGLDPLEIPDELPDRPGTIRPQLWRSRFHSLGSGPGPRLLMRLHEHITATLPEVVPLRYPVDKSITLAKRILKYPKGGLPVAAVGPSGYKRVTIACVYRTADARQRMLAELAELTGVSVTPQHGEPPSAVNERLDVAACHCPELLDHNTVNRAARLDELPHSEGEDHLVVGWLETEYHPEVELDRDAKPHLRRLLGHRGIPTQFLATEPVNLPEHAEPRTVEQRKHAARAALRDLLRSAGLVDGRLLRAIADPELPSPVDRPVLLVGVHVRAQQTEPGGRPLVVTMSALHVDPGDLEACRVLMYSDKGRSWCRAGEATAGFHSGSIGTAWLGRSKEKAERTRAEIERRLCELVAGDLADMPMVVFIDGTAARKIWPGLPNTSFRKGPLPGDVLRNRGGDVAVVRVNTAVGEIGRPVTRNEKANMPRDRKQPAAPDRKVYQLADSHLPSWLFAGRSTLLASKGGDAGARYTRWTLPDEAKSELRKPWHSYTAKEIVVVHEGSWTATGLAALTARLCDQPIGWDGRTLLPGPLHLATRVDRDHPDYRVSGEDGD